MSRSIKLLALCFSSMLVFAGCTPGTNTDGRTTTRQAQDNNRTWTLNDNNRPGTDGNRMFTTNNNNNRDGIFGLGNRNGNNRDGMFDMNDRRGVYDTNNRDGWFGARNNRDGMFGMNGNNNNNNNNNRDGMFGMNGNNNNRDGIFGLGNRNGDRDGMLGLDGRNDRNDRNGIDNSKILLLGNSVVVGDRNGTNTMDRWQTRFGNGAQILRVTNPDALAAIDRVNKQLRTYDRSDAAQVAKDISTILRHATPVSTNRNGLNNDITDNNQTGNRNLNQFSARGGNR